MDMSQEGVCDISLALELCIGRNHEEAYSPFASSISRKPSLTLSLSNGAESNNAIEEGTVSSFFTTAYLASVKKENDVGCEEAEAEKVSSRSSDEEDDGGVRKKLRLTKEQSALLENRFKEHSTINPKQKQALAEQLKLRPRQIEVWFQNRRARTKLKQMEVDCEFLRKCCQKLSDENRRLQKELQRLKALKVAPPLYMHFPAAANDPTICPSRGRSDCANGGHRGEGPLLVALPL